MAVGISLHIGLNEVSAAHYAGWSGPLNACEADAQDMRSIATSCGFEAKMLLTREATRAAVERVLKDAAARLYTGDILLLSYSGHGGQLPDSAGEEGDGKDETWCLYDGQLLDDELYGLLAGFRADVRIVILSDSCHSGTVAKLDPNDRPRYARREIPSDVAAQTYAANKDLYDRLRAQAPVRARGSLQAAVLLLSACQDHEIAGDGSRNGVFTGALRQVWNDGAFSGDYVDLHRAIGAETAPAQNPNLVTMGAHGQALSQEAPFYVAASAQPVSTPPTGVAPALVSDPSWESVQALLRARFGAQGGLTQTEEQLALLNSQLAQRGLFGAFVRGTNTPLNGDRGRGGTVVRAFFWGFHIEISHKDLQAFLSAADPVNALIGSIGGAVPSPAAPFIALAAAFVAGALGLLRSLDQGNGVYISMSWFAPGVFIPTTVPTRSSAARGEIVEFGSDRIGFGPNWREDRLIDFRLPEGGVRDGDALVYAAPGSNGNCYFVRWLNPDNPRDGRFWLHIGSPFFGGGGQCVWVVNGHYENLDVFPPRAASKARKQARVYREPASRSLSNGHILKDSEGFGSHETKDSPPG
jgi:metacaspase-1